MSNWQDAKILCFFFSARTLLEQNLETQRCPDQVNIHTKSRYTFCAMQYDAETSVLCVRTSDRRCSDENDQKDKGAEGRADRQGAYILHTYIKEMLQPILIFANVLPCPARSKNIPTLSPMSGYSTSRTCAQSACKMYASNGKDPSALYPSPCTVREFTDRSSQNMHGTQCSDA
jgi:hypothetical protein